MNLLPEQYVERSKNKARSSRVAIVIIATLCIVAVVATHSRFAVNSSVQRLVISQARANSALELEVDATSLKLRKAQMETFINRYKKENTVFPMGDLVATISNMLPESMTLEELSLDLILTEEGKGIGGRISGFALSDETIASLVSSLQSQPPFGTVSMDFSKSRVVRGIRTRGFRISFLINLEQSWNVSRMVSIAGGEK